MLSTFLAITTILVFIFLYKQHTKNKTNTKTPNSPKPRVPDWHKNATIYEVNLRHFTPEGTFRAFEAHLPRLKEMGVTILWLMPIHEISKTKRKGGVGSPYAVKNYKGVNPDFGTMGDFKQLLKAIHAAGMYCIIDWVPNHSGWDNNWITDHPDWYVKDKSGNITDPINHETGKPWGWVDVAGLNYDNPEMRKGMIDAMSFWIKDIGIDGFRMDVAHIVPVDFWEECSDALYSIKPIFMLAEAEHPAIRNNGAFVMDYGWEMHHLMNDIAKSRGANKKKVNKLEKGNVVNELKEEVITKNALNIDVLLAKKAKVYTQGYSMQFTSNHDENAWAGTEFTRMGAGNKAFAVLAATFDGMPLIYSGQESGMDRQLAFFEKDEIPWGDYSYASFYKTLFDLKHRNKALWNGVHGGPLVKIKTGKDNMVYAFVREKEEDRVVAVINLSGENQEIKLKSKNIVGDYVDVFSKEVVSLNNGMQLTLPAWEYLVLEEMLP